MTSSCVSDDARQKSEKKPAGRFLPAVEIAFVSHRVDNSVAGGVACGNGHTADDG